MHAGICFFRAVASVHRTVFGDLWPLMGRVLQAEAIASTLGQQQRALAEKPGSEVVIAEERHPLSLHDKQEELRIVLTRPLVEPCALEMLQVWPRTMHPTACLVEPILGELSSRFVTQACTRHFTCILCMKCISPNFNRCGSVRTAGWIKC